MTRVRLPLLHAALAAAVATALVALVVYLAIRPAARRQFWPPVSKLDVSSVRSGR